MNLEQNVSNARQRERKATKISVYSRGNELIPNYKHARAEQCALRQNRNHTGSFRFRLSAKSMSDVSQ